MEADGPYSHPAALDADVAGLDVPFADPGLRLALGGAGAEVVGLEFHLSSTINAVGFCDRCFFWKTNGCVKVVGCIIWQASLGGPGAGVYGSPGCRDQAHQGVVVSLFGIGVEVHSLVRTMLETERLSMVSIAFLGTTILLPKQTVGSRPVWAIL